MKIKAFFKKKIKLTNLTRVNEKKRDNTQPNKNRNEREDIITDTTKYKGY